MRLIAERPNREGWYWFKRDFDGHMRPVHLIAHEGKLCAFSHAEEHGNGYVYAPVETWMGKWSNEPIQTPYDPDSEVSCET